MPISNINYPIVYSNFVFMFRIKLKFCFVSVLFGNDVCGTPAIKDTNYAIQKYFTDSG